MIAPLAWIGRRSNGALALGFLLAFVVPTLADALRPMLPLAVAGLLVVAALRTDAVTMLRLARRPGRWVYLTAVTLLVSPPLVWLIATGLALPSGLTAALVLAACLPPLMSVPAMMVVLRLDVSLALFLVLAASIISPFTLGPMASALLDVDLSLTPIALVMRLAGLVLGGLLVGFTLRRVLGARRIEAWDAPLAGFTVVLLLLFAVAIMEGVPAAFRADPARVLSFIAAAFALNLGLQALAAVLALPLGRRAALSAGFVNGNRSLGLLLAVLPASVHPDLALFLALGQFPIYLLPYLVARPYRALLRGGGSG